MAGHFGELFGESIHREHKRLHRGIDTAQLDHITRGRILLLFSLLFLGISILFVRLFMVTLLEGEKFRQLSAENRIREETIPAPRGILYDRDGNPLVRNIPVFTSTRNGKTEILFGTRIPTSGTTWRESVAREYIDGPMFAHALGYTGEVTDADIATGKFILGDMVGKMGVEKTYDHFLQGKHGKQLVEVDALGERVRLLGKVDPIPGNTVNLTLSHSLQKAAAESLGDHHGAVVVSNPKTGEILALYSFPSFDPNAFIQGNNVEAILHDAGQPLFDRAIAGLYPPGSTFKIITAVAALESGKVTADTTVEDTGVLRVGTFSFGNWYFSQYGRTEGILTMVDALKRSNDIYFYTIGETVGIETIAAWARKFGIEETLGVDLAGQKQGLMPDPVWQEKTKGEPWYLGNTYHVAIGQGDILASPLHVNLWTNVIANDGKRCQPFLRKEEKSAQKCTDVGIKKETLAVVKEGMYRACSPASDAIGSAGTGWPLFHFRVGSGTRTADGVNFFDAPPASGSAVPMIEIPVACKTGTAEYGDPKGKTHAWFTAFAPLVNPEISVTVLVESGGEGSSVAGPIAKDVLSAWFTK